LFAWNIIDYEQWIVRVIMNVFGDCICLLVSVYSYRWQREPFWPWISCGDTEQKKKERELCELVYINCCAASEQLQLKISEQEEQNAKRDEEHRQSQSQIASSEKLVLFMKDKDPELATYLSTDSTELEPATHPTTTTPSTLPTTAATAPAITVAGTTPLLSTSATISNTSSNH